MEAIKNKVGKMASEMGSHGGSGNGGSGTGNTAPPGQEDKADKGLDMIEEKVGAATGHPVDPQKFRSQNEKATDALDKQFEERTGKNVPNSISN